MAASNAPIEQLVIAYNPTWMDKNGYLSKMPFPYLSGLRLPSTVRRAAVPIVDEQTISDKVAGVRVLQHVRYAVVNEYSITQSLADGRTAVIDPNLIQIRNANNELIRVFRSFHTAEGELEWVKTRQQMLVDLDVPEHYSPATTQGLYVALEARLRFRWMRAAKAVSNRWRQEHPWRQVHVNVSLVGETHTLLIGEAMSTVSSVVREGPVYFGHTPPHREDVEFYNEVMRSDTTVHPYDEMSLVNKLRAELAQRVEERYRLELYRSEAAHEGTKHV